jgi:sigma-B regulation protein RsbU (phosphoserine phosphatase)
LIPIGFEITGRSIPANHVGGDHYAYFWLDEEKTKFAILIADVSGHEMKAAMMVMRFSEILHYEIQGRQSPKEILIGLNHSMFRRLERRMFVTACVGVLDLAKGSLEISNAGHPLVYHRSGTDGRVTEMETYGRPLGVAFDAEYQEVSVPLMSGDTLVFYTDGIYEAQNGEGEVYGFERLEERIQAYGREGSAVEMLDHILKDVKGFIGESLQGDDMTLVVVKAVCNV